MPGDAKALAVVPSPGTGPSFLVSRNNSSSLEFTPRGTSDSIFCCVRLRGLPGNPTGVGARVTLVLPDGTSETQEVEAGSGYYSQSSPACLFNYAVSSPAPVLRVRWPNGKVTEQPVNPGTTALSVAQPAS